MHISHPVDWSRQLRPLYLDGEPIPQQFARRRGVVLVASALLSGLILFILSLFAAFGRWDLGLIVGLCLFGIPLGWIWWDYWRLGRNVARFSREAAVASRFNPELD